MNGKIWVGELTFQYESIAAIGKVSICQIGGPTIGSARIGHVQDWNDLIRGESVRSFSPAGSSGHESSGLSALNIEGRIRKLAAETYVGQQKDIPNRQVIIVDVETFHLPAANTDEQAWRSIYKHFHQNDRYAVLKSSTTNNVKDMYLVPLGRDEPIPSFISWIPHSIPKQRNRDMLLGVIIIQKGDASTLKPSTGLSLENSNFIQTSQPNQEGKQYSGTCQLFYYYFTFAPFRIDICLWVV